MKVSKYSCEMWLAITAQSSAPHLQGLLQVAVHLTETGFKATSEGVQLTILVLLLVHICAIGTCYSAPQLSDFACTTAKALLAQRLFDGIFTEEKWTKVLNFDMRLFRRSQIGLFSTVTDFIPFSAFSLPSLFSTVFPTISLDDEECNDWRDSTDPIGSVYSESSISSQPLKPIDPSAPPSKLHSSIGGVEDEQRDLVYRITEDS